jgi:hypothetical protein
MEALSSSETSALTRATRRNITEDVILHNHSRENLKSYNIYFIYRRAAAQAVSRRLHTAAVWITGQIR